jgi:hypothetical protein
VVGVVGQARPDTFEPGERSTLEIGSGVVLGGLGVGLQLGRWPFWAALVAVAGYLAWVILYSEVSIQAKRRRSRRASDELAA